jgi:hypothetical protein
MLHKMTTRRIPGLWKPNTSGRALLATKPKFDIVKGTTQFFLTEEQSTHST